MNDGTYNSRVYSDRTPSLDSKLQSLVVDEMQCIGNTCQKLIHSDVRRICCSLDWYLRGISQFLLVYGIWSLMPPWRSLATNCPARMAIDWKTNLDCPWFEFFSNYVNVWLQPTIIAWHGFLFRGLSWLDGCPPEFGHLQLLHNPHPWFHFNCRWTNAGVAKYQNLINTAVLARREFPTRARNHR